MAAYNAITGLMVGQLMIQWYGTKPLILDDNGYPLDDRSAKEVIASLIQSYPIPGFVYIAEKHEDTQTIYKIGITGQEITSRLRQIRSDESDSTITILHTIPCKTMNDARSLERWFHRRFFARNIRGEWFDLQQNEVEWILSLEASPVDLSDRALFPTGSHRSDIVLSFHALALATKQSDIIQSADNFLGLTLEKVVRLHFYGELGDVLDATLTTMQHLINGDQQDFEMMLDYVASAAEFKWTPPIKNNL